MAKLPRGVTVEGAVVRVDLSLRAELAAEDGVLELPALDLILVRGKAKVRAFCAFCPHKTKKKRPVRQIPAKRPAWICRHHDWTFDHKGRPTGDAEEGLSRYRVEETEGELRVYRR